MIVFPERTNIFPIFRILSQSFKGYGNDSQIEGPLWENMVLATEPIKMIGFYFIINIEL